MNTENTDNQYEAMFSGIIGQDYRMLKRICPFAAEMSRLVGLETGEFCKRTDTAAKVVELGGGTGITTLALLSADDRLKVLSIDNEPVMQEQARQSLGEWIENGRLALCTDDALSALRDVDSDSADVVASAYTLHNFRLDYREQVMHEVYRVLKPGGRFVNGDRYALDDIGLHTRAIQREVAGYFDVLKGMERLDLLEHWIIHLFSDESEDHVMRESVALRQLNDLGFRGVELKMRHEANALVVADKSGGAAV